MALAGLLAGAPQPGKPMFMETRVETHGLISGEPSDPNPREHAETLTIKLGRITGEPFEALPPSRRVPEPGPCTEHAHNYRSGFATCQCGQATRTGDCRGWKTEVRGSEFPPMADRYNRTASILRPYDSEGGAGMLPQMAQRVVDALEAARTRIADLETVRPPGSLTREECEQAARHWGIDIRCGRCAGIFYTGHSVGEHEHTCATWRLTARDHHRIKQLEQQVDALDHHRKDASRNAAILREIVERLGVSIPPCSADEWSMKARQTIIDALPAQARDLEQATERTKLEAPEMVTVLRGLHLMRRHLDEGGHDWRSGTQMSDVKAACDWLDATTTLLPLPALLTQQEWLERIRSALGVEHYSLSIKAITTLRESLANSDAKIIEAQQREISATDALREVADRLGVIAPGGPEWLKIIRDQCIAKYEAARKAEGLAVDALRTVSEAFQAVREHMGAPFIPSGPGWAEQTRDACAVAFNQVKAATYAHESLIKALGYAPGTVPWARCLKLVRETITQRNDARQEAATLASKMFDARKEVDGLRKARAYERNALHQVARALSVTPEADSTDTMDDCLKAIDRMRHLRMDAEAENRGLREKDTAIAEILTDVQKRAVMNRAGRLDDTLVFAIAEGQARYSASPHDAIRHATALAFEVRGHRQAELRAVAEREADLSRQAGCNIAVLDMAARSEGTLTNEGAIRLHRHLAACPVCRATDDFGRQAIVDDRNRWQEGKRQAEAALDAIRDHLGIRREDLSSPWVDSAKDQIIRAIDGLKEFDRKAINSARAAAQEAIRVRLAMLARNPKMAGKETASWPLESALATVERAVQRLWDEESCWVNRQPALMLDTLVERMLHDFRFLTGQHDSLNRANTEIRKMVGADSMPMTDTVTAVREALTKGAGNAAIVAAIDRLTASQAEGVALLKRLHGVADLPLQEAGMVPTTATATNITAAQIRTLHNSFCDNTATDAARRHMCRIALGECCVSTKGQHVPFEHRYPTEDEIADAKRKLASHWNGSRLNSETATPTGQPQG